MKEMFRRAVASGLAVAFLAQTDLANAQGAQFVRIPKGTILEVEVRTPLNTGLAQKGDPVSFTIANDIKFSEVIAIPGGTPAVGVVAKVQRPKSLHRAELHIRLLEIQLANGDHFPIKTGVLKLGSQGEASRTSDAIAITVGWSAIAGGFGWFLGSRLCIPVRSGQGRLLPCDGRKSRTGGMIGAGIGVATTIAMVADGSPGPDFVLLNGTVLETKLERAIEVPVRRR